MLKGMAEQSIHRDGNIQVVVTGAAGARVERGNRDTGRIAPRTQRRPDSQEVV
jgi:hypothetical protein